MEDSDGLTIMATKFHADMDEAFRRRLNTSLHFPQTEEWVRPALWRVASLGHARFVTV